VRARRSVVVTTVVASLFAALAPAAQAGDGRPSFIVVLKDSVEAPRAVAAEHSAAFGAEVTHVYRNALKGYAAHMDEAQLGALRADGRVAWVERDQRVSIDTTQSGATWGLDRIDERDLNLNGDFSYDSTGSGVTAYVIDTGIQTTHGEFGGRASWGSDVVGGQNDCNGHGTHVAGTIGGSTYGVAKGVTLVAVRVLDCGGSGSWSGVIAGIDWIVANHPGGKPAVANMSLGGGASASVDAAVSNAIAAGITFAVAAGNSNADACRFSPARVPAALTVGATTSSDAKAPYSNFGKCLDLFAPGSGITSAWIGGNAATNTISGTSMATPHVAGVVALALEAGSGAAAVVSEATLGKVTGLGSKKSGATPNRLLYTNGW
jgi:subtilisin family serine protease